jgi:orotate phosphoribosyltransferase
MSYSEQIASNLLEKGAVRISVDPPFTWTSGIKSPIYCDNRQMISHFEERDTILRGFEEHLNELGWEFDVIGGTATAAIPWAAFLAERMHKPMIYIRPEPKAHGAGKQVEGDAAALKGQKVLILEDLFSTGGSSIKSAQAVEKEMESEIVGIMSIFTYGFASCEKNFEESGYRYDSLTNLPTLLQVGVDKGLFSEEDKNVVLPFAQDPKVWFDNL